MTVRIKPPDPQECGLVPSGSDIGSFYADIFSNPDLKIILALEPGLMRSLRNVGFVFGLLYGAKQLRTRLDVIGGSFGAFTSPFIPRPSIGMKYLKNALKGKGFFRLGGSLQQRKWQIRRYEFARRALRLDQLTPSPPVNVRHAVRLLRRTIPDAYLQGLIDGPQQFYIAATYVHSGQPAFASYKQLGTPDRVMFAMEQSANFPGICGQPVGECWDACVHPKAAWPVEFCAEKRYDVVLMPMHTRHADIIADAGGTNDAMKRFAGIYTPNTAHLYEGICDPAYQASIINELKTGYMRRPDGGVMRLIAPHPEAACSLIDPVEKSIPELCGSFVDGFNRAMTLLRLSGHLQDSRLDLERILAATVKCFEAITPAGPSVAPVRAGITSIIPGLRYFL